MKKKFDNVIDLTSEKFEKCSLQDSIVKLADKLRKCYSPAFCLILIKKFFSPVEWLRNFATGLEYKPHFDLSSQRSFFHKSLRLF